MYLISERNYTNLHMTPNQKMKSSKTLRHFEEILVQHPDFKRIHRSIIINRRFVAKIMKGRMKLTIVMENGEELNIPIEDRTAFVQWLSF